MTIREIESGSDIMEVNRLAGLIWHEAYRGIVSREQIAYMIEPVPVRAGDYRAAGARRLSLFPDGGRRTGRRLLRRAAARRAAVPEQSLPLA